MLKQLLRCMIKTELRVIELHSITLHSTSLEIVFEVIICNQIYTLFVVKM